MESSPPAPLVKNVWEQFLLKLDKAEYIWRPKQALIRLLNRRVIPNDLWQVVALPWGLPLRVNVKDDVVGRAIWKSGIHDLVVSETLWRLIEADALVIDAGSHVGYMASLMATRVGPGGEVLCFEPHPELFAVLSDNCQSWRASAGLNAKPSQLALSDCSKEGVLFSGDFFTINKGVSRIIDASEVIEDSIQVRHPIKMLTLDEVMGDTRVAVMKVDVEEHELALFRGAEKLISEHRVRDIVFEDFQPFPSDTVVHLQQRGYTLFAVGRRPWGPVLSSPEKQVGLHSWEPPTYLATCEPERARKLMTGFGWSVLRQARH